MQVRVLRDYGISTSMRNDNLWSRRDLHVDQDGVRLRMTLWNNQVTEFKISVLFYHSNRLFLLIEIWPGLTLN